ncbi:hypothetical protein NFJ02_22g50460 [Pycnococcus provasolii]
MKLKPWMLIPPLSRPSQPFSKRSVDLPGGFPSPGFAISATNGERLPAPAFTGDALCALELAHRRASILEQKAAQKSSSKPKSDAKKDDSDSAGTKEAHREGLALEKTLGGDNNVASSSSSRFTTCLSKLAAAAQEMQLLVDLCDHVKATHSIGVRHAAKPRGQARLASVSAEAAVNFGVKKKGAARAEEALRAGAERLKQRASVRSRFARGVRSLRRRWILRGLAVAGVVTDVAPPGATDADAPAHVVAMAEDGALRVASPDVDEDVGNDDDDDDDVRCADVALERWHALSYASMLSRHVAYARKSLTDAAARGEAPDRLTPSHVRDLHSSGDLDVASFLVHQWFVHRLRVDEDDANVSNKSLEGSALTRAQTSLHMILANASLQSRQDE